MESCAEGDIPEQKPQPQPPLGFVQVSQEIFGTGKIENVNEFVCDILTELIMNMVGGGTVVVSS